MAASNTAHIGRPKDVLLDRLMIALHDIHDPKARARWGCAGTGCRFAQAGRTRRRWLPHAVHCGFLAPDAQRDAQAALGIGAPSLAAAKAEENVGKLLGASVPGDGPVLHSVDGSTVASPASQALLPRQPSVAELFGSTGRRHLKARGDFALIKLFCAIGMAPSTVNAVEWRGFTDVLNPSYQPPNRDELEDKLIPSEAEHIRQLQLEFLRTQTNLSITSDGGSNRARQTFYTFHISTPDRQQFFIEAHNTTGIKHSAQWLSGEFLRVSVTVLRATLVLIKAHGSGHGLRWATAICGSWLRQHQEHEGISPFGDRASPDRPEQSRSYASHCQHRARHRRH
jgi:hypothetical protein